MPSQLSTILYISDYQEKTTHDFFIGTAMGHTRLEEESNAVQTFNITVFYPINETKPCYIPRLKEGQVLSVSNSKFTIGTNNTIDLILTSATTLDIAPENLPIHQINVVGIVLASESAVVTEDGVQFDGIITDYLSKEKPTDTPVTLFHPAGSRFTNQTTTVKRGSSIFFSGTLTSIDGKFYVELHNFSFLRGHQSSFSSPLKPKMPWLKPLVNQPTSPTSEITLQSVEHSASTPSSPKSPTPPEPSSSSPKSPLPKSSTSKSSTSKSSPAHTIHKKSKQQTPTVTKRKTRSTFKANKMPKLADLATNALAAAEENPTTDE